METEAVMECVRDEISRQLATLDPTPVKPLPCNKWLASSAMQKAIRRGDTEIAHRAAATLLLLDPVMLRRRLLVVAAEDVGLGDPVAMSQVSAAMADNRWRRNRGEGRVMGYLVEALASAPKNRDADLVAAVVCHHPRYAETMEWIAEAETEALINTLRDPVQDLVLRAIAAMYAAGTRQGRGNNVRARRGCDGVWDVLFDLGAPASLVAAARFSFRRTGSALALWVTLFQIASHYRTIGHPPLPDPVWSAEDIPLYAVDYHTRVGKQAVREWRAQSPVLRPYPLRGVQLGLFYTEGSVVRPQLHWEWSERLYALGTEAEMVSAGLTANDFLPIRKAVENELPTLNELRQRLVSEDASPLQAELFGGQVR